MIYIASKTCHASEWRFLRDRGVPVSSTWIDEAGAGESADLRDLWRRCVMESSEASCLVAYMEEGEILKGAYAEIGCALSNGKPVLMVGFPKELSMLSHPLVIVMPDIETAIKRAIEINNEKKK